MATSREGGGLPKGGGFSFPTAGQLKNIKSQNADIKARGGNVKVTWPVSKKFNANFNRISAKLTESAKSGAKAKAAGKKISDINKDMRDMGYEVDVIKIDSRKTGGITGEGSTKVNPIYRQMDR